MACDAPARARKRCREWHHTKWSSVQASALDTSDIGEGCEAGTIRARDAQGRDLAHNVMSAFAFHAFWPKDDWMLG